METHKYKRGHLVVFSGEASKTGAARMSATAGLKAGAGLVTIAAPTEALAANSAHLTAVMLHAIDDAAALGRWLEDARLQTFVLGPGFGIGKRARKFVSLLRDRRLVLDADGISSFKDDPQRFVFQGVHMILDGDHQRPWKDGEKRESRIVFIGKKLPEEKIRQGFAECVA